jgi:hypothetical protein
VKPQCEGSLRHAGATLPGTQGTGRKTSAAPLIDRKGEIADMSAALEATLGGRGGVVLLAGEPGIGKTRLASVLADEAASRGVPVWRGRGWEDGSAPAYWPWNVALRGWIDRVGPEGIAAAGGPWLPDLAHVFPALRDRLSGLPPSETSDAPWARFRLFDIVSRFLAAVAAPAGLVVVLDDVHWADGPSLKLLEFVAADVHEARVLIVATYRDTEVGRGHAFFATLSRLLREPSTRRLSITGLSAAHCAQWVTLAGMRSDAETLGATLHRETNGNPFFLGEIVRLLTSEGSAAMDCDVPRVPHGVREVVSRRVDRLGDDCRATLAVAALLGDAIDTDILRQTLGDAQVVDHLERAADDRILTELDGTGGHYRFAHALTRRVLADDLRPSERAGWHARIASVLERQGAASDAVTTELVHHLAAAGSVEALRQAFDHACRGAEHAARELGWEEAVRLYEVALDVGGRCSAIDPERTIELQVALARALRGAGDVPAARAQCEQVIAACRRTPRPVLLARAALIHVGPIPEFGRVDPIGRALLEEACRGADVVDDGLRARLYARLAVDLIGANEIEQAARVLTLCDEGARAARRANDAGALAMALLARFYAAALRIRPAATDGPAGTSPVPSPQEILEAAAAGGDHDLAAAVRHLQAVTWFAAGDAAAFSAEVDGIATMAVTSRAPDARWLADALSAMRATVAGRFAEAHELIERALATGRRMQLPNAAGMYASQRIMWHLAQGRVAEIVPEIEAFVDGHPGGAGWRPVRALARLARGDVVAARAEFRGLLGGGLGPAASGATSRSSLAGLAFLCVALRDREHAPMLLDRVARQKAAWVVDGCQTFGPWALVRGELARLCGRPAEAARHFEAAIRLGEGMGSLPVVARAQSLLAIVRLSMEPDAAERRRIADLVAEAAQSAHRLGLVDVTARLERLHGKLAGCDDGTTPTFQREGEVWTVRYRGQELRLKDGKGPRYLAALLAVPGHECHVLQLAAGGSAPEIGATAPEGLSVGEPGAALDDAPDARARREYRARLEDLHAELEEAERFHDCGRVERLRAELDVLRSQLSGHFGTRPRTRGPAETARKAVTKVLRTQIGKLLELHPALGQHLLDTVRMGTVCVYAPAMADRGPAAQR